MLASVGRLVRQHAQTQAAPLVATSTDRRAPFLVDGNDLHVELYRSRRSGRPLALIGAPMRATAIPEIRRELRATDRLWHVEGEGFLLLPESDRGAGERLVARLGELGLLVPASARIAVFPDDALTSESLVSAVALSAQPTIDEWPRSLPVQAAAGEGTT